MITKEQLRSLHFNPWSDESETLWSCDGDRVMYNIKEQKLYDADEVCGEHIELCRVTNINDLKDLVYSYFLIELE